MEQHLKHLSRPLLGGLAFVVSLLMPSAALASPGDQIPAAPQGLVRMDATLITEDTKQTPPVCPPVCITANGPVQL